MSRGNVSVPRRALLAAAAALTAALLPSAPAGADELKIAHFMSPRHPMDAKIMRPLTERIAEASGGALTARIYPAGELGKGPLQQYKRAVDGVADIVFGIPGYTSTQFPKTLLIALPGIADSPAAATRMLWGAYDDHLAAEFARVKLLALWTNDLAVLITKDRPVRSPADLAGLKIRAPDAVGAKVLEAWGAVPVTMPVSKVYNAFNTGVVDGVFIGASGIASFKLHEIGRYYTTGLPSVVAAFYLVMNRRSWDRLDDQGRATLTELTGPDLSLEAATVYKAAGDRGLEVAASAGGEIIRLDSAAAAAFEPGAAQVREAIVAELDDEGKDGSATLAALMAAR